MPYPATTNGLPQAAGPAARFDFDNPAKWHTVASVPVLDEHEMTNDRGEPVATVDAAVLQEIAANNNRRVLETGDPAPLVVGHTSDDPRAPEKPVAGYAVNYHVKPFRRNPDGTVRYAIHADFKFRMKYRNAAEDYPRRSVELWWNKKELDPIALLGGTTPERDLGVVIRHARMKAVALLGGTAPERDLGLTVRYDRGGDTVVRYALCEPGADAGDEPERMAKSDKVGKVMSEFKAGSLHSGSKHGPTVTSRKQAVAIALSEAGKSRSKKYSEGGEAGGPEDFDDRFRAKAGMNRADQIDALGRMAARAARAADIQHAKNEEIRRSRGLPPVTAEDLDSVENDILYNKDFDYNKWYQGDPDHGAKYIGRGEMDAPDEGDDGPPLDTIFPERNSRSKKYAEDDEDDDQYSPEDRDRMAAADEAAEADRRHRESKQKADADYLEAVRRRRPDPRKFSQASGGSDMAHKCPPGNKAVNYAMGDDEDSAPPFDGAGGGAEDLNDDGMGGDVPPPEDDTGGDDPLVAKVFQSRQFRDLEAKVDEILSVLTGEAGDDGMGMSGGPGAPPPPPGPGAGPMGPPPEADMGPEGPVPPEEDDEARSLHGEPPVRFESTGFAGPMSTSVPAVAGKRYARPKPTPVPRGVSVKPQPKPAPDQEKIVRMQRQIDTLRLKLARSESEKLVQQLKEEGVEFADEKAEIDLLAVLDDQGRDYQVDVIRKNYKRKAADPAHPSYPSLARFARAEVDPASPEDFEPRTPQEASMFADLVGTQKMSLPEAVKYMRSRKRA